jgi:hypothetical protein
MPCIRHSGDLYMPFGALYIAFGLPDTSCDADNMRFGTRDMRCVTRGVILGGVERNPEQLYTTGWSACFEGAIGIAARNLKVALPEDLAVDAEVDLTLTDCVYALQARLDVSLPGIDREVAQASSIPRTRPALLQGDPRRCGCRDHFGLNYSYSGGRLVANRINGLAPSPPPHS